MERCVIVDYGSGNLRSVEQSFLKAATNGGLKVRVHVSAIAEDISRADRIVLPGVGAFGDCAASIRKIDGLWEALETAVRRRAVPFFGICVGMQLMARQGEEHGLHQGFAWLDGRVVALDLSADPTLKVPQMGWNSLNIMTDHAVLKGIASGEHVYFVHSYAMTPIKGHTLPILADVDYGGRVTAMVGQDTFVGTQFHPEKSQKTGLKLIENFLRWAP